MPNCTPTKRYDTGATLDRGIAKSPPKVASVIERFFDCLVITYLFDVLLGDTVHGLSVNSKDNDGVTSLSSVEDTFNDMFDELAQQRLSLSTSKFEVSAPVTNSYAGIRARKSTRLVLRKFC